MAGQDLLDQGRARSRQTQHEDRVGRVAPLPRPRRQKSRREHRTRPHNVGGVLLGVVVDLTAPDGGAGGVVLEGLIIPLGVLQRLAQGVVQVKAVVVRQVRLRQPGGHGGAIGLVELDGLEVGQAPPGFAKARRQLQRLAISGHAIGLTAHGLQRMAIAHPALGLVGIVGQHRLIDADRRCIFAQPRQDRGAQIGIAGVARIAVGQALDLEQGLRGLVLAIEHGGQVVPGGGEAGGDLQAADQQPLGVLIAPQPRAGLGQHPQGGDIGGMVGQMIAQQLLGLAQSVVDQGGGGLDQVEIAGGGAQLLGQGLLGAGPVAHQVQPLGQTAPGLAGAGVQPDGALEGGDRLAGAAQIGQRQTQFQLRLGHVRQAPGQGRDRLERRVGVAAQATGGGEHHGRIGVPGNGLQNRFGLLPRQHRISLQQAPGVFESRGEAALGRGRLGGHAARRSTVVGEVNSALAPYGSLRDRLPPEGEDEVSAVSSSPSGGRRLRSSP